MSALLGSFYVSMTRGPFAVQNPAAILPFKESSLEMICFFTYRLFQNGRIIRVGKGSSTGNTVDDIAAYVSRRYSAVIWHTFDYDWHRSEGAAFKREQQLTDAFERATGQLPPLNVQRGGGGGRVSVRCRAALVDGSQCQNDALAGNYYFCGVHRRLVLVRR